MMFGFKEITIKQIDFQKACKRLANHNIRYARFSVFIDDLPLAQCFELQKLLQLTFFRADGCLWVSADREALRSDVTIQERVTTAVLRFLYSKQRLSNQSLSQEEFNSYALPRVFVEVLPLEFTRKRKTSLIPTRLQHLRSPKHVVFMRSHDEVVDGCMLHHYRVVLNGFEIIRLLDRKERNQLVYWQEQFKTMRAEHPDDCERALKAYLKHQCGASVDVLNNLVVSFTQEG